MTGTIDWVLFDDVSQKKFKWLGSESINCGFVEAGVVGIL